MTKRFSITIEGEYDFTVEELWPDGDAPENPTAADVRQLIKDSGGVRAVIRDWGLDMDLHVHAEAS